MVDQGRVRGAKPSLVWTSFFFFSDPGLVVSSAGRLGAGGMTITRETMLIELELYLRVFPLGRGLWKTDLRWE